MSKLEPSSVARSQSCHVSSQDLQNGFVGGTEYARRKIADLYLRAGVEPILDHDWAPMSLSYAIVAVRSPGLAGPGSGFASPDRSTGRNATRHGGDGILHRLCRKTKAEAGLVVRHQSLPAFYSFLSCPATPEPVQQATGLTEVRRSVDSRLRVALAMVLHRVCHRVFVDMSEYYCTRCTCRGRVSKYEYTIRC